MTAVTAVTPVTNLVVLLTIAGHLLDLWLHGIRFARGDPCQHLGRDSQAAGSSDKPTLDWLTIVKIESLFFLDFPPVDPSLIYTICQEMFYTLDLEAKLSPIVYICRFARRDLELLGSRWTGSSTGPSVLFQWVQWGVLPRYHYFCPADDAEVYHLPAVEVFEVYALRAGASGCASCGCWRVGCTLCLISTSVAKPI